MASGRSSSQASGKHEWNSYENYRVLHEKYLKTHPAVEGHDIEIQTYQADGETYVEVYGSIRCRNGVVLEVSKYAETEIRGGRNSRLWVRTFSFRYNAHIPGRCTVLRYDNGHSEDFEEYHCHEFDTTAGEAVKEAKQISRHEMPHLSEVLDEIDALPLPSSDSN